MDGAPAHGSGGRLDGARRRLATAKRALLVGSIGLFAAAVVFARAVSGGAAHAGTTGSSPAGQGAGGSSSLSGDDAQSGDDGGFFDGGGSVAPAQAPAQGSTSSS